MISATLPKDPIYALYHPQEVPPDSLKAITKNVLTLFKKLSFINAHENLYRQTTLAAKVWTDRSGEIKYPQYGLKVIRNCSELLLLAEKYIEPSEADRFEIILSDSHRFFISPFQLSVLKGASGTLRSLCATAMVETSSRKIFLRDGSINRETFTTIVNLIYKPDAELPASVSILEVIAAAQFLNIPQLCACLLKVLEEQLKQNKLSVDEVLLVYEFLRSFENKSLMDQCFSFLQKRMNQANAATISTFFTRKGDVSSLLDKARLLFVYNVKDTFATLEQILIKEPGNLSALTLKAFVLIHLAKLAEAETLIEEVSKQTCTTEILLARALLMIRQKKRKEALQLLDVVLEQHPNELQAVGMKEIVNAYLLKLATIEGNGDNIHVNFAKIVKDYKTQNLRNAHENCGRLLVIPSVAYWKLRAKIAFKLGIIESIDCIAKIKELNPECPIPAMLTKIELLDYVPRPPSPRLVSRMRKPSPDRVRSPQRNYRRWGRSSRSPD